MSFSELKKYRFFRLPPQVIFTACIVFAMIVSVTLSLMYVWNTRVDYTFGYLMPVFCLYVLFDRNDRIFYFFALKPEGEAKGIAVFLANMLFGSMLFCGMLVFLLFSIIKGISNNPASSSVFPMTFGFSFAFFALAYFAAAKNSAGEIMGFGQRLGFAKLFIFPAFAWIISAPMFQSLESAVSVFLLSKVANVVAATMDMFGYVVELKGNSLYFPKGPVGVADACSGIRSLTACLFAGSFLAAVFLDKFWKKFSLVALSMFMAFFFNILRALFLSLWAYEYGPESISGFVHDAAGYFVLGATVASLLLIMPLFQLSAVPPELRAAAKDSDKKADPQ